MQVAGKNTRIAGKNTRQTQAKRTELQTREKIPAQSQAKNLQFHTEVSAIAGNLLSHRG